jgi:hypothetical protein
MTKKTLKDFGFSEVQGFPGVERRDGVFRIKAMAAQDGSDTIEFSVSVWELATFLATDLGGLEATIDDAKNMIRRRLGMKGVKA